ncbi:uncharacterized protein MONOS_16072 [Monocercomonoides exilis]|uniref:uncharacterized protein n=1 Tax=Monocercomonoides exilis TaxID=2049356 RepID=UPI0035594FD3|nr:hypothetical protein MONOS_16072 [Monocercomonoides exilis]|eukprot:MONOS_16072.1-p1 / transcript=MONOS_16072.1 / gene=MONOS_16072 / organism=Monocercomonoides_exilis_PA203 / gene_product=unspecified product / transcript_product=unspecified product / location=Mono_scaffold01492:2216-2604(-) / protein_length=115 / sequence_SO=supercontig / SO=protein_coding / is_pseudo=false
MQYHQEHYNVTHLVHQSVWELVINGFYQKGSIEEVTVNELNFVRKASRKHEDQLNQEAAEAAEKMKEAAEAAEKMKEAAEAAEKKKEAAEAAEKKKEAAVVKVLFRNDDSEIAA